MRYSPALSPSNLPVLQSNEKVSGEWDWIRYDRMTQRFFLPSGSRMNAQKYSFRKIRQYASGHPPRVNQIRKRIANPMMMGYVRSTTATDHPFFSSFSFPTIFTRIRLTLPHPYLDLSQLLTAIGASATSFPNRASCIPRTLSS